ncbi:SUN domain-containing ossification factor-like isoform X3 [Triplophysa dalaica]|uniref:SUN domain-containing ossification factor-like isoform X3 n=1 Tax=Triplophysa dalaica TaxID=1582913 RepID=UPI0024DFCB86|nr:SUN domain-containing ossification factor-like isoform X3 [Triplophysa dalaica]
MMKLQLKLLIISGFLLVHYCFAADRSERSEAQTLTSPDISHHENVAVRSSSSSSSPHVDVIPVTAPPQTVSCSDLTAHQSPSDITAADGAENLAYKPHLSRSSVGEDLPHVDPTEKVSNASRFLKEQGGNTSPDVEASVPCKDQDIPTFDEWTKLMMENEKSESTRVSVGNHGGKQVQQIFSNYASVECGAKILSSNPEAKSTSAVLMDNMDMYMLNPCNNKIWFIVELCQPIQVKQLDIANFEIFSSNPRDFLVSISDRYPTNKWVKLGRFHARDERTVQSFPLNEQMFAKHTKMFTKYMKVELLSHFGSEHFCPLSMVRVFGTSMMEEYEMNSSDRQHFHDDPDDDPSPDFLPLDEKSSRNLIGSAKDVLLTMVNNIAANVLGGRDAGNCSTEGLNKSEEPPPPNVSVSVVSDGLHVNETSADHPIVRLLSGDEESDQSSCVTVSQRSCTRAHSLWEYLLQRSLSRSIVQKPISSSPDTKQNLASIAEKSAENSQTKSSLESASSILQPSDHLHASSELTHPVEAEAASVSTEDSVDRLTPEKPVLVVSSPSLPQVSSSLAAVDGPAPNSSIDERTPTRSATDGSQSSELLDDVTMLEMTTADLPSHGSGQKESVFMRLNNRIKVLEMNMSLSGRYLEQLSQRYRRQMEDMQRAFNQTLQTLQNTSRIAEEQDLKQTESIQTLHTQLENVSHLVLLLSVSVSQLQTQVSDRQSYIVSCLVLCVFLGILICLNHRQMLDEVSPLESDTSYCPDRNVGACYEDATVRRRASDPLSLSSFQISAAGVEETNSQVHSPVSIKNTHDCKFKKSSEDLCSSGVDVTPHSLDLKLMSTDPGSGDMLSDVSSESSSQSDDALFCGISTCVRLCEALPSPKPWTQKTRDSQQQYITVEHLHLTTQCSGPTPVNQHQN